MIKSERQKIIKELRLKNEKYLIDINDSQKFKKRLTNLENKLKSLLRKELGSQNSLKFIPRIAGLIFGLLEDVKRLKLPPLKLDSEIKVINKYIISALEGRRSTNYFGECKYGETLLNLYLDLYISFTTRKTEKEIEAYPGFLINPLSGSNLEIDVLFEDFKIAFEFQGEHHYTDLPTQNKDIFKLHEFDRNNKVLIPVNVSQLNHEKLSILIANTIKDFLDIHTNLITKNKKADLKISNFYKLIQRTLLAEEIFKESLSYLDGFSYRYISNMSTRMPITSSTNAPRLKTANPDLKLAYIYYSLRFVK